MVSISTCIYEFHISAKSRRKYQFDQSLFSTDGRVIFRDFFAIRQLADKINKQRDDGKYIHASDLNAAGLIDEVLHLMIAQYKKEAGTHSFTDLLRGLQRRLGAARVDRSLVLFAEQFPPSAVFNGEMSIVEYMTQAGKREVILEEMLLLYVHNCNPAMADFHELINDDDLRENSDYLNMIEGIRYFFELRPGLKGSKLSLFDQLLLPAKKHPKSLSDQLRFIRKHWAKWLKHFLEMLDRAVDWIREETRAYFGGPGPTIVPRFGDGADVYDEPEAFSKDLNWMPNVVLIAKSTYVWLDQLSKKYARSITRLQDIPEEELKILAERGFTGLWLIGLWERSAASQKIKHIGGNPEAVSSAYSLYDYNIAADLGGDEGYAELREKAWKYGVRLASDMVPNHTGIFSKWVIEHPDWFIQSDHPPFPGYSFNGPDLSDDDRVGIFIEDGYWDKRDAAVVFKRVDKYTGDVKYLYHGNDGTSMPWNDTAQLNYLMPEVREAVIQTILHVARKFPIIRFDAAMTLAKKHFQRLWFPQPGSGGDIPSRAEHSLTRERFDELFPVEFWREVVDRVAQEVPDTLLLAEAFWMMEGYFVRTLGMHRVYNSAFMNMLKNEENAKFRQMIFNTLEFNPQIMKRYVNFMNNPDEDTAVAQFGKGDKYFGVCVLMATLPGLPMFGHGQIEGYTEKYGMEYRRAYYDEQEDEGLVRHHENVIFPLLKRRRVYSEVDHFVLYDFIDQNNNVNENVFGYSNSDGRNCSLVIYNNSFQSIAGLIHYSIASGAKNGDQFVHTTVAQALGAGSENVAYIIFRDHITGLEYIRDANLVRNKGLYVELAGYQSHVLYRVRCIDQKDAWRYDGLYKKLNGKGIADVESALLEMELQPLHQAWQNVFGFETLDAAGRASLEQELLLIFADLPEEKGSIRKFALERMAEIENLTVLEAWPKRHKIRKSKSFDAAWQAVNAHAAPAFVLNAFMLLNPIGKLFFGKDGPKAALDLFDRQLIRLPLSKWADRQKLPDPSLRLRAMFYAAELFPALEKNDAKTWQFIFAEHDCAAWLGVNSFQGVDYFNREALVTFLYDGLLANLLVTDAEPQISGANLSARIRNSVSFIARYEKRAEQSGYRVREFLKNDQTLSKKKVRK